MKKLTLDAIRQRLAEIVAASDDSEAAHSYEDALYADVLDAIAKGACEKPKEAAALALTTKDMSFTRWYA
jgi:hypothetical protein